MEEGLTRLVLYPGGTPVTRRFYGNVNLRTINIVEGWSLPVSVDSGKLLRNCLELHEVVKKRRRKISGLRAVASRGVI